MALYQSEATHFLKALKAQRPGLEARQREGRAIWWDKGAVEPEEAKRLLDSSGAGSRQCKPSSSQTEQLCCATPIAKMCRGRP